MNTDGWGTCNGFALQLRNTELSKSFAFIATVNKPVSWWDMLLSLEIAHVNSVLRNGLNGIPNETHRNSRDPQKILFKQYLLCVCVCVFVQSLQLCLTLCHPVDCSPPGSSVHGIPRARILEWVAMPPPGDLPDPGTNLHLLHCRWILYRWATGETPILTYIS